MTEPEVSPLWQVFNLASYNPDPGGGILYAINYDTENLLAHRAGVSATLVNAGAIIFEMDESLAVDLAEVQEPDRERAKILLEELSVVNEAVEYHESGFNPSSIEDLADKLRKVFLTSLFMDKSAAFDIANISIPQIVRDIRTAQSQNDVLSESETETIENLSEYAEKRAEQIAKDEIRILQLGGEQ